MTTIAELKDKVKSHHGAIGRIAKESMVTDQWVRRVLNGGFQGDSAMVVIKVAIRVCAEMDKERAEKLQQKEAAKQALNKQVEMLFAETCV